MAAPLPGPDAGGLAHGDLRAHPRSKFDVPVLEVALRTPAAYIGAMGSRRTHEDRLARLREAGWARRNWPGSAPRSAWTRGENARGDRGVGRRRADPAALGWLRQAADHTSGRDPPLSAQPGLRPVLLGWPSGWPSAGWSGPGRPAPVGPVAGVLLAAGAGSRLAAPRRWSRWRGPAGGPGDLAAAVGRGGPAGGRHRRRTDHLASGGDQRGQPRLGYRHGLFTGHGTGRFRRTAGLRCWPWWTSR